MRIETVETDSFTMDYFKFGHGKEVLVILPGLSVQSVMNSANEIAKSYRSLTCDFTVYVFDRRKELPPVYSPYEIAHDTAQALLALGLTRVCVFGASLGGMIAMSIAVEQPSLVKKLVLCSTSARVVEDQFRVVEEWVRLAKAGDSEGLYLAFGKALYPQETYEKLQRILVMVSKSVTDEELGRFIVLAESMRGFDILNDLGRITCPVLVIGDEIDQILGAHESVLISDHLGNRTDSRLYFYSGYGHAVYDTASDFKERMFAFLKE